VEAKRLHHHKKEGIEKTRRTGGRGHRAFATRNKGKRQKKSAKEENSQLPQKPRGAERNRRKKKLIQKKEVKPRAKHESIEWQKSSSGGEWGCKGRNFYT